MSALPVPVLARENLRGVPAGFHSSPAARAACLRHLAAAWLAELRTMGPRPRMRVHRETQRQFLARTKPWHERRAAIASAIATAESLEQRAQQRASAKVLDAAATPLDAKAVALKSAGLTFLAVAAALSIPRGTAQTWVRRARLGRARQINPRNDDDGSLS
jgi:DNA-directed RNA polymerase specialized sigma24 family protein